MKKKDYVLQWLQKLKDEKCKSQLVSEEKIVTGISHGY